eukprot:TRINITY_DN5808_c0_g1_i1.p1 TRINITY_DN5808_c0_g1~~TRINITY_DN5808_c0_g1_i1.p1  ORF type:complete len:373 (-),score=74.29 TRINITY_DN5808_c0_g1_i1:230-1348(-)
MLHRTLSKAKLARSFRRPEDSNKEEVERPFPGIRFNNASESPFPGVRLHHFDTSFPDIPPLIRSYTSRNIKKFRSAPPKFITGSHSIQGRRPTMEDTLAILTDVPPSLFEPVPKTFGLWAVFDGHAGSEAAIECQDLVPSVLLSLESFRKGRITEALAECFVRSDAVLLSKSQVEGWKNGTTAALVVITDFDMHIANVGDTEVVLARKISGGRLQALCLSEMHRCTAPEEKKRIIASGGMVVGGRLFGDLTVSRALGDHSFKRPVNENDLVSAVPFVKHVEVEAEDEFLIIACDGVWDKMTYQEAVDFIAKHRNSGVTDPTELSKLLVEEALRKKSTDNITTIIVLFEASGSGITRTFSDKNVRNLAMSAKS